jgi:predicted transposase/invertase (TIGR01784 family)
MYIYSMKYANPYTDFAFKRLFGTESNKGLLIDFLNCLVNPEHQIADLEFRNSEGIPTSSFERKAFFDIRCRSVSGQHFIVEMQKAKFNHFKDRALFYSSYAIKEQGEKGEWDFKLEPVYFIAILDFKYDEHEEKQKFLRDVKLKDQDGEQFSDSLSFKFLQMPLFNKTENELTTHFEKWCYFLKNVQTFENLPAILNEPVFTQSCATLKMANFNKDELDAYEESLKAIRDMNALKLDYLNAGESIGFEKGKAEGIEEGKAEERVRSIQKALFRKKLSDEEIAEDNDISLDFVLKIKQNLGI